MKKNVSVHIVNSDYILARALYVNGKRIHSYANFDKETLLALIEELIGIGNTVHEATLTTPKKYNVKTGNRMWSDDFPPDLNNLPKGWKLT